MDDAPQKQRPSNDNATKRNAAPYNTAKQSNATQSEVRHGSATQHRETSKRTRDPPPKPGPAECAKRINPPTTACGLTGVFETPSVLRESLPSYSAKPGAFYAPRALRWTTPPRGRTDPFQGPKIKPIFHRCSTLFQDLGVENGGQNEVKILPKSSLGAFQDGFGAGLPGDGGC